MVQKGNLIEDAIIPIGIAISIALIIARLFSHNSNKRDTTPGITNDPEDYQTLKDKIKENGEIEMTREQAVELELAQQRS